MRHPKSSWLTSDVGTFWGVRLTGHTLVCIIELVYSVLMDTKKSCCVNANLWFCLHIRQNVFPPGTAAYCPPEYHVGGMYYGRQATAWSLGVLMFLMLCGHFPRDDAETEALVQTQPVNGWYLEWIIWIITWSEGADVKFEVIIRHPSCLPVQNADICSALSCKTNQADDLFWG